MNAFMTFLISFNIVFIIVILSFFFVNTWASPGSSFILFPTRGWSNYLPISMWLFTLIALAIIIATTASAITVVIIICFLSQSLWSRRIFGLLFYMLSFSISLTWNLPSPVLEISHLLYIRLLISHTQDLLFHLYECKGNAFFLNSGNKWVTKWWKKAIFWYKSNTGSQPLDAGQLLSVSYFTYFRISLLFLPFLAGSGINPSVSPVLSVIAWNTEAA